MKIYLACPYSHPRHKIRKRRFEAANKEAAKLIRSGHVVFSPLSHSHPIAKYMDNANDSKFWVVQDKVFIEWCDKVVVLCIEGWDKSKGVLAEIKEAGRLNKPVTMSYPEGE
jgi:nucleoside 2-deoxyribosyltransferase